jgi:hypothetical protein
MFEGVFVIPVMQVFWTFFGIMSTSDGTRPRGRAGVGWGL